MDNATSGVFTGGSEYYIKFSKGQHEVREVLDEDTGEYKVVHQGHYEECRKFIKDLIIKNYEYDNNI